MASPSLEALGQRLQGILSSSYKHQEKLTVLENPETHPPSGQSICSKCAATCSTASGLANHYRKEHVEYIDRPFACPYEACQRRFRSEQLCREHNRLTHRSSCRDPSCQCDFPNVCLLAQHEDEHNRRNSNFRTRTCPHPGCGQIFPDQATLFAHYDGLHPLSVYSPGKKLAYKCPFCPKKYAMERYMAGHQRRDHSTNEGSPSEQYESQAALIQESHDSMTRRASRGAAADIPFIYPAPKVGAKPHIQREDDNVTIEKHTIYMDDGVDLVSHQPHSPGEHVSQTRSEKMAIGYVLQSNFLIQPPPNTADEEMDGDEDYPETYALDHYEMLGKTAKDSHQTSDQFSNDVLGQRIIHWVLTLLDMNHWLTASEVLELWDAFLTPAQRVIILEQFRQIDVGEEDTAVLSALHGSVLCEVIHAWARFKLLTLQLPEDLRLHATTAKGTTWAILRYCTELETLIKEGRLTASALGLVWPVSLREAPADGADMSLDVPFVELLAALEARVKCRTVHPSWMQFTNELVLKEMTSYLQDLKTEAEATRNLNLRTIDWFGKMDLL